MQTTNTGSDLELPENPEARRAAIKNVFPVEIRCPECGGVAFYYRTLPIRGREFSAMEAMYPDGSRPVGTHPSVQCGSCHAEVPSGLLTWRGKSW